MQMAFWDPRPRVCRIQGVGTGTKRKIKLQEETSARHPPKEGTDSYQRDSTDALHLPPPPARLFHPSSHSMRVMSLDFFLWKVRVAVS